MAGREKKMQQMSRQLDEPLYDTSETENRQELFHRDIKEYLSRIKTVFQRTERERKEREAVLWLLEYNEYISLLLIVIMIVVRIGSLGMIQCILHGEFEGKSEQLLFVSISLLDVSLGICLLGILLFKKLTAKGRKILSKVYFIANYLCTGVMIYALYLDVPHFFNVFLFCFDLIRGAGIMWVYMLALQISSCSLLESIIPYCLCACVLLCFHVFLSIIFAVSNISDKLQAWINKEYVNIIKYGRFQYKPNPELVRSLTKNISNTLGRVASLLMLLLLIYSIYVHWCRWVNKRVLQKTKPRMRGEEKEKLLINQILLHMVSASTITTFSLYLAFYNVLSVQKGLISGIKTTSPIAKVFMQFIE